MKIEPLSRVAIANIDFPFAMEDNDGNRTHDGFLTTSFENVKKTIDRARTLGFDAIALECNMSPLI